MQFFFILKFSWYIVDPQGCDNFCCTTKWFSHTYIHAHYLSAYFPTQIITKHWVDFPVLYSRSPLASHSIYSMCICQFQTPRPPLPTLPIPLVTTSFSKPVSSFPFCKQVHLHPPSDSTCKWHHVMSFFQCLTSSMTTSRSTHVAANGIISLFLWLSNILLYICTISSLSIPQSMDI